MCMVLRVKEKNEEAQLSIDPKRANYRLIYKREKENSMPTAKAGGQS